MKPAWDKLIKEYKGSKTALVADVDCTAEGKDLCETHGVQGFPTIKYGDPSDLEAYEGGRDFESLQKFAKENLKPMCSPSNLDLCDAEKKKEIEGIQALSDKELEDKIAEKEAELKKAEENFEAEVKKLQETYEKLQEEKDKAVANVKSSGLGLMKSVKAAKKKETEPKKEL
jgi:hypothetical protein